MAVMEITIDSASGCFSHADAARVFDRALRCAARLVVIDLRRACDATTAAFAELIRLRRALLRRGRDLRLSGLHDRAAHLYLISRLAAALPCV